MADILETNICANDDDYNGRIENYSVVNIASRLLIIAGLEIYSAINIASRFINLYFYKSNRTMTNAQTGEALEETLEQNEIKICF